MFASTEIVSIFAPAKKETLVYLSFFLLAKSVENGEVAQLVRASDS